MYFEPVWLDQGKTIIRFEYRDPVSVQDIVDSMNKATAMLGSVEHNVQFIVDLRGMISMPRDLVSSYPAISRVSIFKQENFGRVVMVLDNSLLESVVSIFSRVYVKIEFVKTMDEAYLMLGVDNPIH